jgi:hypothetical protein
MWEATVTFKDMSTGEEVLAKKSYSASDRITLESQYMKHYKEYYDKGIYFTIAVQSPIGWFFEDPSGWGTIHLGKYYGIKEF